MWNRDFANRDISDIKEDLRYLRSHGTMRDALASACVTPSATSGRHAGSCP